MGYQPLSEPERLKNNNCDELQSTWVIALLFIAIPAWLVCFPMFIVGPDIPTVGAIFISVLTTPVVGIVSGLLGNIFGFFHDSIQTVKYNKKKAKFDEQTKFENWIKGCRNGRN